MTRVQCTFCGCTRNETYMIKMTSTGEYRCKGATMCQRRARATK